jgi:F0F1-type ATP synthase assembly protein I
LPADLLRPNRVACGNLAKMSQQKRGRDSTAWMSLAGLGLEFAAAVAGFAALGWWLDREFGTEPTALLICVALGLIGGMYNLIRQSLKAARRAEEERKHKGSSGEQDRLS